MSAAPPPPLPTAPSLSWRTVSAAAECLDRLVAFIAPLSGFLAEHGALLASQHADTAAGLLSLLLQAQASAAVALQLPEARRPPHVNWETACWTAAALTSGLMHPALQQQQDAANSGDGAATRSLTRLLQAALQLFRAAPPGLFGAEGPTHVPAGAPADSLAFQLANAVELCQLPAAAPQVANPRPGSIVKHQAGALPPRRQLQSQCAASWAALQPMFAELQQSGQLSSAALFPLLLPIAECGPAAIALSPEFESAFRILDQSRDAAQVGAAAACLLSPAGVRYSSLTGACGCPTCRPCRWCMLPRDRRT